MLGCQAGCLPVEDPAKWEPSLLPPARAAFLCSAGSRCSGETGEACSDSRGAWGLWVRREAGGAIDCLAGGLRHVALDPAKVQAVCSYSPKPP